MFRGEQDAIKVNNLVVAHWLNIFCKRGGVSNGIIAMSTGMYVQAQRNVTHAVAYLHFHLPDLSTQKTGQRIVSTSIQLTFQCTVGCLSTEIASLKVLRR